MKCLASIALSFGCLALSAFPAFAQSPGGLVDRVTKLESRLDSIESKIDKLLAAMPTPTPVDPFAVTAKVAKVPATAPVTQYRMVCDGNQCSMVPSDGGGSGSSCSSGSCGSAGARQGPVGRIFGRRCR